MHVVYHVNMSDEYNSTVLHSSTNAKERCSPAVESIVTREKSGIGSSPSLANRLTNHGYACCSQQRQVVYAGSGERVSHTDAVLPFASLIWPNHGRQPPLDRRDGNTWSSTDTPWKRVQLKIPWTIARRISIRPIFPTGRLGG